MQDKANSKFKKPIPYTKENVGKLMKKMIEEKNKHEAQETAEQEVKKKVLATKAAEVVGKVLPDLIMNEKHYERLPRAVDFKTGLPNFINPDEWQISISFEKLQHFLNKQEMQTIWDFTLNAKFEEPTDMANFAGGFLFFVEEKSEFPIGDFKRFVLHIPCNQFMQGATD
ncbi:hypothetical protein [Lentilactobacillus hilgardii]|uniref:hypothetical protein n=1 Tax=Lentilactobacillus hilgardii TaxID=1588 RepID=UPI0039E77F53